MWVKEVTHYTCIYVDHVDCYFENHKVMQQVTETWSAVLDRRHNMK
jgi:hypothetical protein